MHSTITRFIQLIFVFKDLDGNIMQLNNEFKLLLTIEDRVENEGKCNPSLMSVNQFSMIEMLGNTTKKEVKLDNPLFHSITATLRPCRSIPISCCTTYPPTK